MERIVSFYEEEISNRLVKMPTEHDEVESDEDLPSDHEDIEDSEMESSYSHQIPMQNGIAQKNIKNRQEGNQSAQPKNKSYNPFASSAAIKIGKNGSSNVGKEHPNEPILQQPTSLEQKNHAVNPMAFLKEIGVLDSDSKSNQIEDVQMKNENGQQMFQQSDKRGVRFVEDENYVHSNQKEEAEILNSRGHKQPNQKELKSGKSSLSSEQNQVIRQQANLASQSAKTFLMSRSQSRERANNKGGHDDLNDLSFSECREVIEISQEKKIVVASGKKRTFRVSQGTDGSAIEQVEFPSANSENQLLEDFEL